MDDFVFDPNDMGDMSDMNDQAHTEPVKAVKDAADLIARAAAGERNFPKMSLAAADLVGAELRGLRLCGSDLQKANLRWANLTRASLRGADLRGSNLSEAHLDQANLRDVLFDRSALYRGVDVETIRGNPLFRRFAQDQDYIEAFKARHPISYWIWLIFADCGRSLSVWGAWAILIAVAFGFVFWGLAPHFIIHDVTQRHLGLLTWLYYSVVTFTSLGYGDIVPRTSLGEVLVIIEVGVGYLMLGGMVSILANKLARRS